MSQDRLMVMLAALAFALSLSCAPTTSRPIQHGEEYETVASGLEVPWALAFAPDGRLFFTERAGRIRVIAGGKLVAKPLHVLADVFHAGETGLTGIALHPGFQANGLVYVAYAYGSSRVKVVRFREEQGKLVESKLILGDIPAATIHAGSALSFGPDGKLYITSGDAARRQIAQDLGSLGGKTLRLNDDGTVPADNPFVGRKDARPEIWSYGHRNAQGIAWHPRTGAMWQAEHGPSGFDGPGGGDEVNLVERGKNYGWPAIHHDETKAGMVSPAWEWTPAVAPSGCAFWKGALYVACLRGEMLSKLKLNGNQVVSEEIAARGIGRIRGVAAGPDGALYFTTSNHDGRGNPSESDDRILRLR